MSFYGLQSDGVYPGIFSDNTSVHRHESIMSIYMNIPTQYNYNCYIREKLSFNVICKTVRWISVPPSIIPIANTPVPNAQI